MVGSGTYYAAYFDATNSCYSPTSTPVQVTITTCTTPTNPPLVVIPPMVTEPDKPVTVCGTINDPDIGDTHTVTICSAPTKGTLATPTVNNTTHKVCLTYTPSTGQTGSDQVCLIVCDQTGKCDTVTVPIVITPTVPPSVTPQPPVVVVTGIITPQDSTTTTCMPILDPNGTGTNTYTICGAPKNGTANPITTAGGLLCVTYKPNAGYVGKDSLCLIVCDAGNLCDTILIPITVYPKVIPGTPQPPVVILPPIVTEPGNPVTICGLVNDPNVGDTHTATLCNTPSKGTISGMAINNLTHQLCLTYTPQSGQTGNDEVCVTVCDQTGKCTTVEVPVTIVPANGKPIATGDIAVTPQDKPVTGNVLTNDTDPEGGPLTVSTTPVTPPTKGTVTLNPDGTFTYTPTPGKTGEDVFCYQVSDAQGLKDTACVTVEIVPNPIAGNDAPIAADDNTQTPK
ncbi:cadherin-like domain-containing protein, partial [Runella zeae]|uniref:cadherin-like domain-containing protein n=1 Tax=Runella zeae TaxID=94255 RepID=UPI0035B648EC